MKPFAMVMMLGAGVMLGQGVSGVVVDGTGAPVGDARVTLQFLKPGETQRMEVMRTNAQGEFQFPQLEEALYTLKVTKAGYGALTNESIRLGLPGAVMMRLMLIAGDTSVPPAPATGPGTGRIRVGGNAMQRNLVNQPRPRYPADCRKEGVQGVVLLEAVIGKDGNVVSLAPVNQFVDARLREEAMTNVKQWQYKPTLLNGNPVEVVTVIEVNFTLAP
jgi:TonB family protein